MTRIVFGVLLLCNLASGAIALEEKTSAYQVSGELGGSAFLYSIYGSYRPTPMVSLNLGIAPWGIDKFWVPASVSLLIGESSSLLEFVGGGALAISAKRTVLGTNISNYLIPEFGIGYRYWPKDSGFHFRATLYVLSIGRLADTAENLTIPYPGLSFGYAF